MAQTAPHRRLATALCAFGAGCCAVSLTLPVLFDDHDPKSPAMQGIGLLVFGWLAGVTGRISWFANPAGLAATWLFFAKRYRAATIAGGLALLLAQEGWDLFWCGVPLDEAGVNQGYLTMHSLGFFVWLAGIACVFLACLLMRHGTPGRHS